MVIYLIIYLDLFLFTYLFIEVYQYQMGKDLRIICYD